MVLAVAYAVLALVLSGAKPGPAARPVGIYEPYDADGCDDCVCHGKALCEVRLSVAQEMKQPLMLQFQLDSFYQNHRRYLKSESLPQLARTPLELMTPPPANSSLWRAYDGTHVIDDRTGERFWMCHLCH